MQRETASLKSYTEKSDLMGKHVVFKIPLDKQTKFSNIKNDG